MRAWEGRTEAWLLNFAVGPGGRRRAGPRRDPQGRPRTAGRDCRGVGGLDPRQQHSAAVGSLQPYIRLERSGWVCKPHAPRPCRTSSTARRVRASRENGRSRVANVPKTAHRSTPRTTSNRPRRGTRMTSRRCLMMKAVRGGCCRPSPGRLPIHLPIHPTWGVVTQWDEPGQISRLSRTNGNRREASEGAVLPLKVAARVRIPLGLR
jgi:hypothetical protein